jgi:N-acetyl-alpha-D-muramate 1-phosphate uridylyltransferase
MRFAMPAKRPVEPTAEFWRPKTAMVLAAGLGTRMRPLTDKLPKPLVPLKGRALLDRVLDRLAEHGVEKAVVNVHYQAEKIIDHLEGRQKPKIVFSDERGVLLETGGGVVKALPKLGSEPFIIHNSDSVYIEGVGSNLDRLARAWDPDRMDTLLLLALGSTSLGYHGRGDFNMDPSGHLTRRKEGQIAPFVFTGVSIAHPRLFKDAPDGAFSINKLWTRAIEERRLFGVRMDGVWMHVGDPDAVTAAEHRMDMPDVQ